MIVHLQIQHMYHTWQKDFNSINVLVKMLLLSLKN